LAEKDRQAAAGKKKIRWLKARKITQTAVIFLFGGILIAFQRFFHFDPDSKLADIVVNLPLYLDPLAMIAKMVASRSIVLIEFSFLLTILLTLLFGRVWCGWFCPIGTIQDWTAGKPGKKGPVDLPPGWRSVKYGLLAAVLGLAAFSNLSLMVFDPLTIFYRSISTSLLPSFNKLVTAGEYQLVKVGVLRSAVSTVDGWVRPRILPYQPDLFRGGEIFGFILLAIILLNIYQPRFYCRYLCPLGGLLGLLSRFSWIGVRVKEHCSGCAHCLPQCPTGAIELDGRLKVHSSECTMCMICPTSCPKDILEIKPGKISPIWGAYDPGRRTALISLGAVAIGAGFLGTGLRTRMRRPHKLRPPGADEGSLLDSCLRCGECSAVCPTNAIQLSLGESGLEGLWTPVLVPRIGSCDFSCNACGRVCPVDAIPYLDIEQKREQIIGKAYLNTDRCIAWADGLDCVVCEEMCPLPEKAISLEKRIVPVQDGEDREVLLPIVDRGRCIGCGVCENKCPLSGEAAIRVYVAPITPGLYVVK
jgi:MauM/NapG family ferredoxin protein